MSASPDAMSSSSLVFPKLPYSAFCSGPLTIRETVYGIVKRLRFFISHIEIERRRRLLGQEQVRVLDVGCGTGVNVTIPLAGNGYSIVGVDPDQSSITRARELSSGLGNMEFISGRLEDQTLEPFHVVICSEVLEHLANPGKLLGQIATNLYDGGLLLLSVPNGFGYFEIESVLWRFIVAHWKLEQALYSMEYGFWKRFGSGDLLARRSMEYEPKRYSLTQSTLSVGQSHLQSFTLSRILRLLLDQGFKVLERRNNTLLAGNLIGLMARELDFFLHLNSKIAEKLPAFAVSGWLIAARSDHTKL